MGQKQNIVVVDTSLALKWVVYETDTPLARVLLSNWMQQSTIILAPDLLIYEITNILYKRMRKNELTLESATSAFSLLMRTNLSFEAIKNETLSLKALDFAKRYNLPATYDAHYLALAEREQCEFWTADERLYNAVKEQIAWVRLITNDPLLA